MAAKSDLPQGTLDLLILKVIALGPVHGYAIAQRLQQVSGDVVQVPQGSLYPALHRLENRGLLAADWKDTETGPARGGSTICGRTSATRSAICGADPPSRRSRCSRSRSDRAPRR